MLWLNSRDCFDVEQRENEHSGSQTAGGLLSEQQGTFGEFQQVICKASCKALLYGFTCNSLGETSQLVVSVDRYSIPSYIICAIHIPQTTDQLWHGRLDLHTIHIKHYKFYSQWDLIYTVVVCDEMFIPSGCPYCILSHRRALFSANVGVLLYWQYYHQVPWYCECILILWCTLVALPVTVTGNTLEMTWFPQAVLLPYLVVL